MSAHVFVDDLAHPVLSAGDRHHLERVLRVREGETVTASDGRGGAVSCTVGPALELRLADSPWRDPEPAPQLTVGFALVKHERPEWIVQKLVEAGIDRIRPFVSARTVVRWDVEKAARNVERWRRIAREAAMQSRRTWLPAVDDVGAFRDLADAPNVALAAPDGTPPTAAVTTLLIGPEGGWSTEELASVPTRVRLGSTILRSETAAVAAGVLLTAVRDGLVNPPDNAS